MENQREEIITDAELKDICLRSGPDFIKVIRRFQHDTKNTGYLESITKDQMWESRHKHRHLENLITDIQNINAAFAPDFNTK
ncbi:hypothetical protein DLL80_23880 [Salmonella enterica subsp. enterica serovar Newport]|uniref:Uncharacterized protein n=1 Tax=Salmonella newport TaxID=108619 RepID=A0A5V6RMH2_SALNE|nr:hypothetical protein [Salmonella enterica subsp. enterica serovar Newport]